MPNVQVNATISARDAASKNIRTVNKALGTLGKTAHNIGSDFRKLTFGIAGIAAGVGAFTASAIKDAALDEQATARLNAALKARGFATDKVRAAVEQQIVAGQKLAFTDDEVRASVEASTRFTKDYAVAQKMQTIAMDLARTTGMTLGDATIAVGKAYAGAGGKLLKSLGITKKGIQGQEALNALFKKTKGAAGAYADTVAGSFDSLSIGAKELKEQFGKAFLPAVGRLFKGLAPYIEKFSDLIKRNTPMLAKWADTIVQGILNKLPGLFATFEAKVPKALKSIEGFVDKIGGIGKGADDLLGPGGSITLLVTGIGAAFGGLKGAITANLIKDGIDPFTALIIGNIGEQIPKSLAAAITNQIVTNAVAGYAAKMAAASAATNPLPTGGGPGGLFNFAAIGAALKSFGTTALAAIPVIGGAAAASGGAGLFPMFDPNSPGSLTGPDGPLGFLNQSGNDKQKYFESLIKQFEASGATSSNAYMAANYGLDLKYNPQYTGKGDANQRAYELVIAGFGKAFGNISNPMEAKYTSNIYIGTGKVDTVISDSLVRLGRNGRNP
jgi:hypothetical protein